MSVQHPYPPVTQPVAGQPATRPEAGGARKALPLGVLPAALLTALLGVPAGSALAANTLPSSHAKLVQPSSTGDAKTERQAVVKLHVQTVATPVQHPGKTVGGNRLPHARTIVTKRILPP